MALNWIARGLAGVAALAAASAAQAQSYPTKNVRVLVPFAAAGPTDVIARLIGQKLGELYGHQFYIENVPGAGGQHRHGAGGQGARRRLHRSRHQHRLHGQPEPLCQGALRPGPGIRADHADRGVAHVLVVHPDVPAKSVKELIALIKASRGNTATPSPRSARRRISAASCSS
jgi:tripartite-type tricarboxylate transporter receptor subunit TctC